MGEFNVEPAPGRISVSGSSSTVSGSSSTSSHPQMRGRIRAAQALLWLAAVAAAVAAIMALASLGAANDDIKVVQTWRAYGLVVFAGLFALLALYPHAYRGVWELVLFHKLALTLTALAYLAQGGIPGTSTIIVSDGILVAVLVAAYVLCRGWSAAPRGANQPQPTTD